MVPPTVRVLPLSLIPDLSMSEFTATYTYPFGLGIHQPIIGGSFLLLKYLIMRSITSVAEPNAAYLIISSIISTLNITLATTYDGP